MVRECASGPPDSPFSIGTIPLPSSDAARRPDPASRSGDRPQVRHDRRAAPSEGSRGKSTRGDPVRGPSGGGAIQPAPCIGVRTRALISLYGGREADAVSLSTSILCDIRRPSPRDPAGISASRRRRDPGGRVRGLFVRMGDADATAAARRPGSPPRDSTLASFVCASGPPVSSNTPESRGILGWSGISRYASILSVYLVCLSTSRHVPRRHGVPSRRATGRTASAYCRFDGSRSHPPASSPLDGLAVRGFRVNIQGRSGR